MENYWEYIAYIWDEDINEIVPRYGVVYGNSFSEAAAQIEKYYARDLDHLELFALEESFVYEFGEGSAFNVSAKQK